MLTSLSKTFPLFIFQLIILESSGVRCHNHIGDESHLKRWQTCFFVDKVETLCADTDGAPPRRCLLQMMDRTVPLQRVAVVKCGVNNVGRVMGLADLEPR